MDLLTGLLLIAGGIMMIIVLTSWLKFNSFLSLFLVSLLMALVVLPLPQIVPALKKGFGETMASIGLIIIFGTIIGVTLDITGATLSMANYVLGKTGKKNSAAAISITGFITGLPIFCDSGFIVLSGLNRSLSLKSGVNPVFMSTVLACSLYSVHCLIPPHPGVTAAAGILGANIGQLVLIGIVVAIPPALAAYFWAKYLSNRKPKTRIESNDLPVMSENSENLPGAGRSFMPIILPLMLITIKSVIELLFPGNTGFLTRALLFAGEPVIALMTGMFLSFLLLPAISKDKINQILTSAIEKAGPIIIITAAGGIFGAIIKATGTGEQVGIFLSGTGLGLLIPFLLTFILKTALGSSTVSIITAASIVGPMLNILGYSDQIGLLLVMLSMGAGSMMVSHANDSYFWVITKFSGIDASDTLRVYSTSTIVMGVTAFIMVLLVSLIVH